MLSLCTSEFELDVESLTFVVTRSQLVVRVIHASKENQQRLVKHRFCDIQAQHCEVGLLSSKFAAIIDFVVCFRSEERTFSLAGHCHFDIQRFLNIDFLIRLGLLNHDFKTALCPRRELNDVVCVVVSHVIVSQMEITRCELFVHVNFIKERRIVGEGALLAEDIACIGQQVVVCSVDLASASHLIVTQDFAVNNFYLLHL